MGDAKGGKKAPTTLRGYGPPDGSHVGTTQESSTQESSTQESSTEMTIDTEVRAPSLPEDRPSRQPPAQSARRGTPLVEIEVIHEHGPAPHTDKPWRTLEVWTRNRIYTLEPTLSCVEVRDRATRELVRDHPFLGMRLVGGQHREGDSIELSYPFPRPGTEAVFERPGQKHGQFSRTSPVTRVVLRLHIVTVAPNHVVPTWEEITGSFPAWESVALHDPKKP